MPALYRFIARLSFEGSRLSKLTLKRRNSPIFSGAYPAANPTGIFVKGDIKHPMQTVFNTPMRTNHLVVLRCICLKTTEVEANFGRRFIP